MLKHWLKFGFVAVALSLGGCAAEDPEALDLDPAEVQDEIRSSAWERFAGAWEGVEGSYRAVVFSTTAEGAGRSFFADRTVYCVRAPCNPVRETGVYRATSRHLYLTTNGATERYTYTLRGEDLTLRIGSRVVYRLRKVPTYCAQAADCAGQSYVTPRCLGYRTCESSRCGYRCGVAPGACRTNSDCPSGQFCGGSTCGGEGTCATRPEACIALYNPVCGCDGRTYGSACSAASAGMRVASAGECAPVAPGGACTADSQCPALHFCDRPGCGTSGTCRTGSTVRCTADYNPVCGCDGRTYSNSCMALVAGVSVARTGACR